jgi:malate dehydrogenase (quinone)
MADRIKVLQVFYPEARAGDWKLSEAGIRFQAIKKTDGEAGIVHYGTEILTNSDHTLSALLGASPGASVSVDIALGVIKNCFPDLMARPEGKARLQEMVPAWEMDIKHPDNAACFHKMHEKSDHILQLR